MRHVRPLDPYNAPLTPADRQRGLTLIGLLIAGIFVALIALVGMRIVDQPAMLRHFTASFAPLEARLSEGEGASTS